jgi:hypothetical protein
VSGLVVCLLALLGAFGLSLYRLLKESTLPADGYIIDACPDCSAEIQRLAPDGLDFCPDCERITEGSTVQLFITE